MGATSSFTPPNAPPPGSLPPPEYIEKTLFEVGDDVKCTSCKRSVYEVRKRITTMTKLAELLECLLPFVPEVPLLTPDTQVRKVNAALNCPLCNKEWGIILYA